MTDALEITYIGPPRDAGFLAQELIELGVHVDYDPPFETKDLNQAVNAVASVLMTVSGDVTVALITAAVTDFLGRHPNAKVTGLGTEPTSIEGRLARLVDLRDRAVISSEDYERQRQRILDEL